jgi:hypothetical protein
VKVYIDNYPLAYPQPSLLKPTFTIRLTDELGEDAISFTGDITFIGTDYDYIYQKLVLDVNALENTVILKFVDDCCNDKTFQFEIRSESLKWCNDSCELTAAATEHSSELIQLTCIKNTLVWDNWNNFQGQQHPRFSYCNELRPSWLQDGYLILIIIVCFLILALTPVLLVLAVIVTIINAVINAINSVINVINVIIHAINNIPGININTIGGNLNTIDFDNDPSTNVFQEMKNWSNTLLSYAVGCGRKHPSPLVRNYAYNVCGKCGVQFQSSIFTDANSPYFNACWHEAPVDKGTEPNDLTTYWLPRNQPLMSGDIFFNKLKTLFNANWKIRNGILLFERHDFFQPTAPWLDLTILDPTDYKICWNWSSKKRYSYGQFYYQKDAINWVGSEANDRWGDIVEWNNPYTTAQKGDLTPAFEFTTCRFRDDGIDRDVLSFYKNAPFIGPIIRKYDNAILLNAHTCYTPMILIWDANNSPVDNAKVDCTSYYFNGVPNDANHNPHVGSTVAVNQFYNYPMWFKEGYNGNMYTNFWFIENPKLTNYQGFDYVATITMDCVNLQLADIYGMIKTDKGNTGIREIVFNYETQQIIISGSI